MNWEDTAKRGVGVLAIGLLAGSAMAQTVPAASDNGGLAEIVVTAQKRSERLQDVPIAVDVVSAEQLDSQQVTALTDLSRVLPALEFSSPGSAPGGGAIVRGIGTVAFSESAEPSVGLVVDGVTQFNANTSNLFDVARVEVLEGPQGTLFGQSVSAGVINITTPTPDPTKVSVDASTQLSGKDVAGSEFGRQILQTAINLPITGDSAVRIAAHADHLTEVQTNAYLGINDEDNDYGVRARYMWRPNDQFTVNVIADYDTNPDDEDSLSYRLVPPELAGALATACGVVASNTNFSTCGSVPSYSRSTVWGVSGEIDYDFGFATLVSISSYRKRTTGSQFDVDGFPSQKVTLPLDIDNGPSNRNNPYETQEIRLQSPTGDTLEYVIGGFYSHYSSDYINPLALILNFGGPPIHVAYTQREETTISSEAIFGQTTYNVTHQLRLIAGARVTGDSVHDTLDDASQMPTAASESDHVTNLSWKLGAQYDFTSNLMTYATVSRGFKGPQINDASTSAVTIVRSEIPTNYEIGVKSTILGGSLGANAGLFYESVKDFQAQVCAPGSIHLCSPSNVPEVDSRGIEANVFGKPVAGLTLNLGFIYNPVTYPAGYLASDGTDLGGLQLAFASKTKFTPSAEYSHPIDDQLDGFIEADAVYRSATRLYESASSDVLYPDTWIVGGELGLRAGKNWKVAFFGRNLTNNAIPAIIAPSPYSGAFGSGPSYQQYSTAQSKRLVGLTLNASF